MSPLVGNCGCGCEGTICGQMSSRCASDLSDLASKTRVINGQMYPWSTYLKSYLAVHPALTDSACWDFDDASSPAPAATQNCAKPPPQECFLPAGQYSNANGLVLAIPGACPLINSSLNSLCAPAGKSIGCCAGFDPDNCSNATIGNTCLCWGQIGWCPGGTYSVVAYHSDYQPVPGNCVQQITVEKICQWQPGDPGSGPFINLPPYGILAGAPDYGMGYLFQYTSTLYHMAQGCAASSASDCSWIANNLGLGGYPLVFAPGFDHGICGPPATEPFPLGDP